MTCRKVTARWQAGGKAETVLWEITGRASISGIILADIGSYHAYL